jgi:uncharacterized LabA/DUF88 family protein
MKSAIVYVDAFNLYYGALRHTPFRWLDLRALSQKLVPKFTIQKIRYFTARVRPRPDDPNCHFRQDAYLRALSSIPQLVIHEGHYLSKEKWLPIAEEVRRNANPPAKVKVAVSEEKGSDVNIATYMLTDAFDEEHDLAILISNDSDLAEPVRIVKEKFKRRIMVVNPHPVAKISLRLANLADDKRQLRKEVIKESQFPDIVMLPGNRHTTKPPEWDQPKGSTLLKSHNITIGRVSFKILAE